MFCARIFSRLGRIAARWDFRWWGGMVLLLGAPALVRAEVRGTVINGTTGKPASGVEVHLVVLEGGMQVAEKVRTNAQGRFTFATEVTKPTMVRATYQGVNYHEMVSGDRSVTLRIYEARPEGTYKVERLTYLVQPVENQLLIGREFIIRNETTPPVTLARPEGFFLFTLPEGMRPERVSVIGESGMPLSIGARSAGDGRWRIEYPLRPGTTHFFVVSQTPYAEAHAAIREILPWDVERVRLLVPEPMKLDAADFRSLGTEQGLSVYVLESARAGQEIRWSVSGRAPSPPVEESEGGTTGTVQVVAGPLEEQRWILLAALALAFALGGVMSVRRRGAQAQPGPSAVSSSPPAGEIATLKEELFALEVQHQRGELTDEEYEKKRQALRRSLEAALRSETHQPS